MSHEKLTKLDGGMLRYQYALGEDQEVTFDFSTLAEVGEPFQQWFKDEIRTRGWIVEFGRDLDEKPYVADFVVDETGTITLPFDEDARRQWVASLKAGDEVEVPYSLLPADIHKMTVLKNDGGWLTLLRTGKPNKPENWLKACAVNGWTVPYGFRLVPPGTTVPLQD